MAAAFAHHILVHSKPSSSAAFFISCNKTITKTKNGFYTLLPFIHRRHKTLAAAATDSLLELGGVKISKQDVVKDEPTNNVPDLIFTKLGLQLHRRDNHPLGILKNAIYEYFDTNYNNQFQKFDDLCPIVTTKMGFIQDVFIRVFGGLSGVVPTYVSGCLVKSCFKNKEGNLFLLEDKMLFVPTPSTKIPHDEILDTEILAVRGGSFDISFQLKTKDNLVFTEIPRKDLKRLLEYMKSKHLGNLDESESLRKHETEDSD